MNFDALEVMTFGCIQFIKNKTIWAFQNQYPRAVSAIIKNHYDENLLDDEDTVYDDNVIEIAKQVKKIHENAVFEIKTWLSNSPKLIAAFGGNQLEIDDKSSNISEEAESENVLRVWWNFK